MVFEFFFFLIPKSHAKRQNKMIPISTLFSNHNIYLLSSCWNGLYQIQYSERSLVKIAINETIWHKHYSHPPINQLINRFLSKIVFMWNLEDHYLWLNNKYMGKSLWTFGTWLLLGKMFVTLSKFSLILDTHYEFY